MGSVEAAYQVRSSAEYYVGSADVSGFVYWYNMLAAMDSLLKSNPSISTGQLSKQIVALIDKNKDNFSADGERVTMAAVALGNLRTFVDNFKLVTEYYLLHLEQGQGVLRRDVKKYFSEFADAYDLLEKIHENETDMNAKTLVANAMSSLNDCIVAECHGTIIQARTG